MRREERRAFTLIELLLVIAIVALLAGLAMTSMASSRRAGQQAVNVNNLKQLGVAMSGYAADYKDAVASFTWQPNTYQKVYIGGGRYEVQLLPMDYSSRASGAPAAGAMQALTIIRLRGNPEFDGLETEFAKDWLPHPTFSHLVLLDYLATRVPSPVIVSPADAVRQRILADPQAWIAEHTSGTTLTSRWIQRLAFSGSYTTSVPAFSPDRGRTGAADVLTPGAHQFAFTPPSWRTVEEAKRFALGQRRVTEVEFPAQKVYMFEEVGRFAAEPLFFTHPDARITNLMFDTSVRVVPNRETNRGGVSTFTPTANRFAVGAIRATDVDYDNTPDGLPVSVVGYPIWPFEADEKTGKPKPTGQVGPPMRQHGRQRWTLMGLKGIDIGGKDVIPPNTRDDRRD